MEKKYAYNQLSMANKPSTHRRAHGENGCAVRRGVGRLNNAALVIDADLVHFGIDYVRLCLGKAENSTNKSLSFLSKLFSLAHNDTNAAIYKNVVWADTNESIDIHFGKSTHGQACYVQWKGWVIMSLEQLSTESSFYKNIHGKYQYVVSLYGDFFALIKLGLPSDLFLNLFQNDIAHNRVVHCVSRLDVCADFSGLTVKDIADGIIVHSTKHAKLFTPFHTDWDTRIPETFYYGKTTDKRWHGRIYNKNLDNAAKGKEALFPNYWKLKTVTRLELELREVCREFRITFLNCWDEEFLLSIFKSLLDTRNVQWRIEPFLLKKMKEKGIGFFNLQRVIPDYKEMPNLLFYKRTLQKNIKCLGRMKIPLDTYLLRLRFDLQQHTKK